jgi:integrase
MTDKRRPRNSGGLYQRASDGMWVAAVELPTIGGKRRRKVVVRAKKEAALKELRKLNLHVAKHGDFGAPAPTLAAWCEEWTKRYGHKRKPTGWARDQSTIDRYIVPPLGKVKLDKLSVAHIHRMHAYVIDPKPDGLGLSPTTANVAHRLLSTILEAAYAEEKVTRNVAKVAGAPAVAIVKKDHLDTSQARHLLLSLDPGDGTVPLDLAMMSLSYFTGMRPAERIGLTREMVDLDAGTVTVAWQLQRIAFNHGCGERHEDGTWTCGRRKGGYCPKRKIVVPSTVEARRVEGGLWLTRPKTKAGWRTIPMVGILRDTLAAYLDEHDPGMEGLIFTRGQGGKGKGALTGRPIDPAAYTDRWHELLTAAKIPDVGPHSARHTCNTILTELGVPVDVRIQILGHAGERVNEQVYTHTSDSRVREGMLALDQAMRWR